MERDGGLPWLHPGGKVAVTGVPPVAVAALFLHAGLFRRRQQMVGSASHRHLTWLLWLAASYPAGAAAVVTPVEGPTLTHPLPLRMQTCSLQLRPLAATLMTSLG